MYDTVVVGSGFAGLVMAHLLAKKENKRILLIEKRSHIGGNCYDYKDENGIIVHKYGPHLLHTDYKDVMDFLAFFGSFEPYEHKVLASIDGQKVPLPFNLNTIYKLFSPLLAQKLEQKLIESFGYGNKVPILDLRKSDDRDLKFLSDFIYEKVFLHYTTKQWGVRPEAIDKSVTARVPVVISKDDRYFHDKYQFVPKDGYSAIFEKMLDHPNIELRLDTNFLELFEMKDGAFFFKGKKFEGQVVYTGGLDELFSYSEGALPYRSLKLEFETYNRKFYQEASVINYPNNYDFTRITEFKHIHPTRSERTTILKEYPIPHTTDTIPYYPIFTDENRKKYETYLHKAKKIDNLTLLGRLAEYRYYDMDDVIKRAFEVYDTLVL